MARRIGDVELPLDPPEPKVLYHCVECGEPICRGEEMVVMSALPGIEDKVHSDCLDAFVEAHLGISYATAGDDI